MNRPAPLLAAGIPSTILGLALLGAALFNQIADPITDPHNWGVDTNKTLPLSWCGWVLLVVGLGLVSAGVYQLVSRLERRLEPVA